MEATQAAGWCAPVYVEPPVQANSPTHIFTQIAFV